MCFFFFSVILLERAYQKLQQKKNKSVGKVNAILLTIMTTATTLVTLLNDQRFRNFPAIFSQFQTRMHLNQSSLFSLDVDSLRDKSICTSRPARTSLYSLAYFTFWLFIYILLPPTCQNPLFVFNTLIIFFSKCRRGIF